MPSLTLDGLQLVAAVGALQGVLLAGMLVAQTGNRTANRLLAALMVAFSVFLAGEVYYSTGLVRAWPHFFGVSYQTPWLFGPLVYLYAVAAGDGRWRFRRRDMLHFAPALASTLLTVPYMLLSGPEKVALWEQMRASGPTGAIAAIDPFKYVSGITYSVATFVVLRRHRRRIEQSYANTERVNLRWLLWLTVAAATIWLLAVALRLWGVAGPLRDGHIALAMALVVYGIGYVGMRQPEIFRYEVDEPEAAAAPVGAAPLEQDPAPTSARYERSSLTPGEAERVREVLVAVMEHEQPWRDSALTLPDLAARAGTTPHKLSEVLNAQLGETFYDFVNGYRVREVQRRIAAGDARALKMLALAMDAGFASKSTFNEAFKKHTRLTPSGFREAVGA